MKTLKLNNAEISWLRCRVYQHPSKTSPIKWGLYKKLTKLYGGK